MSAYTDADVKVIIDLTGCGCCAEYDGAEALVEDSCPVDEDDHVDHTYEAGCSRDRRSVVLALLAKVAARAKAEALREGSRTIRKATHDRLKRYEGAPKETASLAIDGTIRLLERLALEAERNSP